MIVITGAAGFIGSVLAKTMKSLYNGEIVLVDDFSRPEKESNLQALQGMMQLDRNMFFEWLSEGQSIDAIFHIGARTDTTEFDYSILEELNLDYTKKVWSYCAKNDTVLIYASSAATYGNGDFGYDDNHEVVERLQPLNPYGVSKNEFDIWALKQDKSPQHWYGLKFFNVYGPNEFHKARMASVIFHAFNQIQDKGEMRLFRSHNPNYRNGEQLRDFVYVKDVVSVIQFLFDRKPKNGLYNLGSGTARTFLDLTKSVFRSLDKEEKISFMDTPEDIRDKYQYFTEANMAKLISVGYSKPFIALEDGVSDYVQNYLLGRKNF
ncbi:ADP-glyceromanno-heptose 6-epimerase [Salibacteraceae bacterium]|nr:ADP-glyceromanno-heptose 6-epimerase [Salibacteraceae bacterium]MDB9709488.1 ADP-glyceromanno-heptose 6-epimerase [Salibacteraceae bacterium]MDC1304739.1 ADP-glyceromanno-heptose 6-epimerase [Salibacteraceae bacterium]